MLVTALRQRVMADQETEQILADVAARLGETTAPNLYRMLARNPAVLKIFTGAEAALEGGVLGRADQAVAALAVAVTADCPYCRAVLAGEARAAEVPEPAIAAILRSALPEEPRPAAVAEATGRIMATKGRLGRAEIAAFDRRGLGFAALLEIVGIVATYTLATHANNLARTRIDPHYRES